MSSKYCYITNHTSSNVGKKKWKKKIQEKFEILLGHVVGISKALLVSFQKSTNILRNMDKTFNILLDKC
jgi:hypothetical protein